MFKKFKDYEPFISHGISYKIALLDQRNFQIIDIYDLAFPKCSACAGYLIPAIVLFGRKFSKDGKFEETSDQIIIDVCTGCDKDIVIKKFKPYGLPSPDERFMLNMDDENSYFETMAYENFLVDTYKYFCRQYCKNFMAIGEHIFYKLKNMGNRIGLSAFLLEVRPF